MPLYCALYPRRRPSCNIDQCIKQFLVNNSGITGRQPVAINPLTRIEWNLPMGREGLPEGNGHFVYSCAIRFIHYKYDFLSSFHKDHDVDPRRLGSPASGAQAPIVKPPCYTSIATCNYYRNLFDAPVPIVQHQYQVRLRTQRKGGERVDGVVVSHQWNGFSDKVPGSAVCQQLVEPMYIFTPPTYLAC